MKLIIIILVALAVLMAPKGAEAVDPERIDTYGSWIQAMKTAPRGPFARIRWFCGDGSIHPPKPYACRERGGGVQHGEWTDQVRQMRADGYWVGTVLADLDPEGFVHKNELDTAFKQIILERFLIRADDGWIFRKARYYRGALQVEDEMSAARRLLNRLARHWRRRSGYFTVLREAARLLPHGPSDSPLIEMRHLARTIEEKDPGFHAMRVKIHVQPDIGDAERVRQYGKEQGKPDLPRAYARLAELITNVYRPREIGPDLLILAHGMGNHSMSLQLRRQARVIDRPHPIGLKIANATGLLAELRLALSAEPVLENPLALLDAGLLLEDYIIRHMEAALDATANLGRLEQMQWLGTLADAMYGIGFISSRQRLALKHSVEAMIDVAPTLSAYRRELHYQALGAQWAQRTLRFHFSQAMAILGDIEPMAKRFVQDRMHGSPLLLYSAILDRLQEDAVDLTGLGHRVFGAPVVRGLQVLNPGLARGELEVIRPADAIGDVNPRGIYVLPETIAELSPVAGILTAGHGNILSHVQLLARNLGIPNVVAAAELLPRLQKKEGRRVILAASPLGVVHLAEDGPLWDRYFQDGSDRSPSLIVPELNKLDLDFRTIVNLKDLRAADSGRIAGPKAANLARLKQTFPQAVTDGIVIPFGEFRALLDHPMKPGGPTMFQWMQRQYVRLAELESGSAQRQQETTRFLDWVRQWIEASEPGAAFRRRLAAELDAVFGPDGQYGVFVRSDTNVEDQPGFTGAGLNLTVPHVVGLENIVAAVTRVWASPFTQRAFSWRQAHMTQPRHVYVSVLLLKSVPVDKSGVVVTVDVDSRRQDHLTVAVSEGIGGAVSGQSAEELRIDLTNGRIRLMAQAGEPLKRMLNHSGGLKNVPASSADRVLKPQEIQSLISFVHSLGRRMPDLKSPSGHLRPIDVEFGFMDGQLILFQIRPFVDNPQTRRHAFLAQLDRPLAIHGGQLVDLVAIPENKQRMDPWDE